MTHAFLRRTPVAAMLAALATGCAAPGMTPAPAAADLQRAALQQAAQFKEGVAWQRAAAGRTGTAAPGAASAALNTPALAAFDDPVLASLLRQMQVGNESLRNLVAAVDSAQAALAGAQAQRQPTAAVSLGDTRSGSPGTAGSGRTTATSVGLTGSAAWELDLWGRLRTQVDAAAARLTASEDDLAAARLSVAAQITQDYVQLRAAEAQQALLERIAAADQRIIDLTQVRYQAGVVARADVLQAQNQLHTVQVQREDAALQRAQYEHAIAALLGKAPAAFTLAATGELPRLPALPALVPSTVLEQRPDIAAAERRVAAAYASLDSTQAAWFPDLTLSATGGWRAARWASLVSAPNLVWSLGASLDEALLDNGARTLATRQARAAADQALSAYRQAVLTAFQEVEDNLAAAQSLEAEVALQERLAADADHLLQITTVQYKAGTVGFLDVASAQTTALQAQETLVTLRQRRLVAAATLLKNLGALPPS